MIAVLVDRELEDVVRGLLVALHRVRRRRAASSPRSAAAFAVWPCVGDGRRLLGVLLRRPGVLAVHVDVVVLVDDGAAVVVGVRRRGRMPADSCRSPARSPWPRRHRPPSRPRPAAGVRPRTRRGGSSCSSRSRCGRTRPASSCSRGTSTRSSGPARHAVEAGVVGQADVGREAGAGEGRLPAAGDRARAARRDPDTARPPPTTRPYGPTATPPAARPE